MEVMDSLTPVIPAPSTPEVEVTEEDGPTVEETYEVTTTRRKTIRTSYKIQEVSPFPLRNPI